MKKFSEIKTSGIDTKRYHDKIKDNLYSIVKENLDINLKSNYSIVENVNVDVNFDLLIEKLNQYIIDQRNDEKVKILESIKASFAMGTLSLKKINEEIEACTCSEECDTDTTDTSTMTKGDETIENEYIDDYDEDGDDDDYEHIEID